MVTAEQGGMMGAMQRHIEANPASDFLPDAEEIENRRAPFAGRATLYVVLAFIASFVLWAAFSPIDRWVVARGQITTSSPTVPLQAFETSIVHKIEVRAGDIVKKGQALATLDPTFSMADISEIERHLSSLDAQIARLDAESSGTSLTVENGNADAQLQGKLYADRFEEYASHISSYDETVAQTDAQSATLQHDVEQLGEQLGYLREIEAMRSSLAEKGTGSKLQMLEAKIQRATVEREMEQAQNRLSELARERAHTVAERDAFAQDWRKQVNSELVTARTQRDTLSAELSKAQRRQDMAVLRAPEDGVVLDVASLADGSVIREAEPVVTLVPADAQLEAEVSVPAREIGFVKAGDDVRVKVDTFPYQKYGILNAHVVSVSENAFAAKSNTVAAAQGTEANYQIRLSLDSIKLENLPASAKLMPGMTLTAEIVVGQRTILSYFLYPLFRTFDEGVREQ